MIIALRQWLGRFKRQRDGLAALEFAFIAPALLLLTIGTMEISMIFFGNALLEGGVRESARFGLTGAMPPTGTREDHVVEVVNAHGAGIIDITAADVTTLVYPNFTSIGQAEPYTDIDGSESYTTGDEFTDINCNGNWDADMGRAGLGSGGEVVVYTVNFNMPMMTGLLTGLVGVDGTIPMAASVTVRNEPFDSGFPGC